MAFLLAKCLADVNQFWHPFCTIFQYSYRDPCQKICELFYSEREFNTSSNCINIFAGNFRRELSVYKSRLFGNRSHFYMNRTCWKLCTEAQIWNYVLNSEVIRSRSYFFDHKAINHFRCSIVWYTYMLRLRSLDPLWLCTLSWRRSFCTIPINFIHGFAPWAWPIPPCLQGCNILLDSSPAQ